MARKTKAELEQELAKMTRRVAELEAVIRDEEYEAARQEYPGVIRSRAEARLAMAMEITGAGIFEYGLPSGKIVYLSELFAEMLGYDLEEMPPFEEADAWWRAMIHPDDVHLEERAFQNFVSGKAEIYYVEIRVRHRSGEWLHLQYLARRFMCDDQGRPGSVIGIQMDVTEQRQTELELRRSQARLKAAFENLPYDFWICDRDGRYVMQNPRSIKNWGNHLGKVPAELEISPEQAREWEESNQRALAGEVVTREEDFCQDGRFMSFYKIIAPIRDEDQIIGIMGTNIDITATRLAEQQVRKLNENLEKRVEERTAELEEVHRTLLDTAHRAGMAEVATNILHNVGNVLNSINVDATVLQDLQARSNLSHLTRVNQLLSDHGEQLATFLTEDRRGRMLPAFLEGLELKLLKEKKRNMELIENLRRNIEFIREIVRMQQSYAKVAGLKEQVQLNELIQHALQISGPGAHHTDIAVEIELAPDLPNINTNRQKVLLILVNLVTNARHSLEDCDGVKILTLSTWKDDRHLYAEIRDTGVGICAENLEKIFIHGFTTKDRGHGFGLHSSANAAIELGGRLLAASEGPGRGAVFTLELPVTRDNA